MEFKLNKNGNLTNAFVRNLSEEDKQVIIDSTSNIEGDLNLKIYCLYNGIEETPKCPTCGTNIRLKSFSKGLFEFCSRSCMYNSKDVVSRRKKTCLERHGHENHMKVHSIVEGIKQTNIEKYGKEHFFQTNDFKEAYENTCLETYGTKSHNSADIVKESKKLSLQSKYKVDNVFQLEDIKEKIKKSNIEKIGVDHHMKSVEHREKVKQTNLEKYGFENPMQCKEIIEKAKQTSIEKYGDHHTRIHRLDSFKLLQDKDWLIEQYKTKPFHIIAKELGVEKATVINYAKEISEIDWNHYNSSYSQNEVCEFVKSIYFGDIIYNTRTIISPKELDVYIPEKNLAIEFNGIYWHSGVNDSAKNYHLNKTIRCEELGIQLLHIFENEWIEKQEIWKSVIKAKLGLNERIYARKCVIKEVSNIEGYHFFEKNHLQGGLRNGKHIGLYHNNELVCCISYGKSRFEKDVYEIYRYANTLNVNVIGGFSKLLKYLPTPIISYANRRWSNGNLYEKNGFELVHKSSPNYFYIINGRLESRMKYQKHKLKGMKSYDENLTEEQIMELEGYRRIYDCGNLKYILK